MTKNIIDDEYAVRSGLQIFDSRRNAHFDKDRRVATSVLDPVQEKFYEDLLSAATARKAEGKKPTPMFRCVIIRPNKSGEPEKREIEFAVLDPDNVTMIENLMDKMEAPRGRGRKPGDTGSGGDGQAATDGATEATEAAEAKPAAEAKVEETKAKVEETKAKVEETKAKVEETKDKVEETKAKVAKAAETTKESVTKAEAKTAEVKQAKAEEAVDEDGLVSAMFNSDDEDQA